MSPRHNGYVGWMNSQQRYNLNRRGSTVPRSRRSCYVRSKQAKTRMTMEEAAARWGEVSNEIKLYICPMCCYIHLGHKPFPPEKEYEIVKPRSTQIFAASNTSGTP